MHKKKAASRTYVLHGYTKERPDGSVVAVCLRPNLVVQGSSSADAHHKMQQLIRAYVETAAKDGRLDHFMTQRAPARFYVEYWSGQVLLALSQSFKTFTETCNIPQHA